MNKKRNTQHYNNKRIDNCAENYLSDCEFDKNVNRNNHLKKISKYQNIEKIFKKINGDFSNKENLDISCYLSDFNNCSYNYNNPFEIELLSKEKISTLHDSCSRT